MATPIRGATQTFLEIADISEDIVIMTDGSCALALETGAVNFGLLSKDEQEAIIYAFAAFLNSLSFPVQISILSKRMDISEYLNLITEEEKHQSSMKLKEKLRSYHQFILSLVKNNTVLEKRFFIIIPFSYLELGVAGSRSLIKKSAKLPYPKKYILERAKTALYPKRDHVIRQLTRLGLNAIQLTNQQLVTLFFELYNTESQEGQRATPGATTTMVNPIMPAQKT